jgi:hypothetical protein
MVVSSSIENPITAYSYIMIKTIGLAHMPGIHLKRAEVLIALQKLMFNLISA